MVQLTDLFFYFKFQHAAKIGDSSIRQLLSGKSHVHPPSHASLLAAGLVAVPSCHFSCARVVEGPRRALLLGYHVSRAASFQLFSRHVESPCPLRPQGQAAHGLGQGGAGRLESTQIVCHWRKKRGLCVCLYAAAVVSVFMTKLGKLRQDRPCGPASTHTGSCFPLGAAVGAAVLACSPAGPPLSSVLGGQ